MPVIRSGPGYNGVTGAKATYNADEDMWIDANGERVRPDAIVPGEPPVQAAAPSSGAPPAASTPASGGSGGDGLGLSALPGASAMSSLQSAAQGFQEVGSGSALNPNLGTRLSPNTMKALSAMAGRNY